ncbi:hypothetical protein vseg_013283 [Gypsophila vaccaria]
MGNSLRCCLACVLPCGALDVIRIVHLNGYVEELSRPIVTADEVLKSYPNHVLSKPSCQGMVRKILIMSPHSHLKRGGIYFLIPNSSLPSTAPSKSHRINKSSKHVITPIVKSQLISTHVDVSHDDTTKHLSSNSNSTTVDLCTLVQHHSNVLDVSNTTTTTTNNNNDNKSSAKSKSGKHQRRRSSRGKSGVWHPHLHSITEDAF